MLLVSILVLTDRGGLTVPTSTDVIHPKVSILVLLEGGAKIRICLLILQCVVEFQSFVLLEGGAKLSKSPSPQEICSVSILFTGGGANY